MPKGKWGPRSLILSAIALSAAGSLAYVSWTNSDPDRGDPSAQVCHASNLVRGAPLSFQKIQEFSIGGVRLGMTPHEAETALRANAGKVEPYPIEKPKSTAELKGKAPWKTILITYDLHNPPGYGPGNDRRHSLRISVTPDERGRDVVTNIDYTVTGTSLAELWAVSDSLEQKFGAPTAKYNTDCQSSTMVAYSPSRKVENPNGMLALHLCSALGTSTTSMRPYSCDRTLAVDEPTIWVSGYDGAYSLIIEDGRLAYRTRYAPGYHKSIFIRGDE